MSRTIASWLTAASFAAGIYFCANGFDSQGHVQALNVFLGTGFITYGIKNFVVLFSDDDK